MFQINNVTDGLSAILCLAVLFIMVGFMLKGKRKKKLVDTSTFLTEPLTFDEASVLLASITLTARFQLATFANREELLNIYAERLRVLLAHDPASVSALNQELKDIIKLTTTEV